MQANFETDKIILAIHSTDNCFGFAYRKINKIDDDNFFIKKFDKDLSNNLIFDLVEFLPQKKFKQVDRICVSLGPANFNASRLIVVLARTLSQQMNCSLDSFSNFELMAKRIAINHNIYQNKQSFWIINKLKRKGIIAGQYEVRFCKLVNNNLIIKEIIAPKRFEELSLVNPCYQAEYNTKEDLKELLNLAENNLIQSIYNSWQKVFPIYPISAIN